MTETTAIHDFPGTAAILRREWSFVIGLLGDLAPAEWARPTRCAGWTIRDLACHTVWGVSMEADALRRLRTGDPGPANGHTVAAGSTAPEVLARLRRAADELCSAVDVLGPGAETGSCPLPYGDIPLPAALDIFVFEAGIHASDFADAVDVDRPLAEGVVRPVAAVSSLFLPVFATTGSVPPEGTSFSLQGHTVLLEGQWTGSGLAMGAVGRPTFAVIGDDSSVLLFANGRLGLDDPRLRVEGATELAQAFKTYVPGP